MEPDAVFERTSLQITKSQREYLERRAHLLSAEYGVFVSMSHVLREAIDLLREHKPVDEPAKVA